MCSACRNLLSLVLIYTVGWSILHKMITGSLYVFSTNLAAVVAYARDLRANLSRWHRSPIPMSGCPWYITASIHQLGSLEITDAPDLAQDTMILKKIGKAGSVAFYTRLAFARQDIVEFGAWRKDRMISQKGALRDVER